MPKNRDNLKKIVETLILCGQQEIGLMGHRDSGRLTLEAPESNDGNFRTLCRFRAKCGVTGFKEHILSSGGRSMYISLVIQNQLISIIGSQIQRKILERVQVTKYFKRVGHASDALENIRNNAEKEFQQIFTKTVKLAEELNIEIRLPRRVGTQKHGENYQAENAEQYYRVIPIIEDLIRSLEERFLGQKEIIKSLDTLIPVNTKTSEFKHLLPAIEKYSDDLNTNNESMLRTEFELWQMKCASFEKQIRTAVEALQECTEDMFPNINKLLVMLAVLPVILETISNGHKIDPEK
ncbi:unnamed protein product [Psylliodes chrysocephalus]|uniref:Uncharacterized protein n=1 Tax=Psylliodes chrysocephalus TaxID=3402493 RepID=A0A9P0GEW0_9CUCU|nr:unnamed protein product [Psylliodes chrysocephala]